MNTKKFLSTLTAAAILASMLIQSVSATITTLPWSKDFSNSNPGVNTPYTSFQATWGNWDCVFYSAGGNGTLTAVNDDEDHGIALRADIPTTAGADSFVMWTLPDVSSGKLMFQFDIKSLGNTMVLSANEANNAGYNPIIRMENNQLTVNGEVLSTYNLNEWKTIKCLFDCDTNYVTVYVDGASRTFASPYHKAMKFVLYKTETTGLLFDNLQAYMLDMSVSPAASYYVGSDEIGQFVDVDAEQIDISLANSEFSAVPQVSLKSMGSDFISSSDDIDVDISTSVSNGKLAVSINDYLEEGSYKLTLSNAVDMFGRSVSNSEIIFIAGENGGWVKNSTSTNAGPISEDFNVSSVGGSGFGTSKMFNTLSGTPTLVSDSKYSSGKALRISNGAQISANGIWTPRAKKGKLHIETKMEIGAGSTFGYDTEGKGNVMPLIQGQNIDITGDSVADNTLNFRKQATADYPGAIWDQRYLSNGLDKIDYTIDFDNMKANVVLNDTTEFTIDVPNNMTNSAADLTQGIRYFRLQSGASSSLTIDYFNWYHEYLPMAVKDIKFLDAEGNEIEYNESNGIAANSKLKIYFSEAAKEAKLSGITVTKQGANVAYTGVWSAADNSYTITFTNALDNSATYTLSIPNTVQDSTELPALAAMGTFRTAASVLDVSKVVITDTEGNEISDLSTYEGTQIKVTATTQNTFSEAKNIILAYAGYDTTEMKEMNFGTISVPAGATSVSATFTLSNKSALTKVKAFALKDMDDIAPYCAPDEI